MPPAPTRGPALLRHLYTLVVLALLALVLANFGAAAALRRDGGYGLRIGQAYETDDFLLYRLKPRLRMARRVGEYERGLWGKTDATWAFSTNSLGFRDFEDFLLVHKPEGRLRILAVGDSHTFGLDVGNSSAYPARLQRRLNRNAGEKRFEVVNAGVPGYSSRQGLIYLTRELGRLSPDMVILQFGSNDASRSANFLSMPERRIPDRALFPDVRAPIPADLRMRIFWLDRYLLDAPLIRLLRRSRERTEDPDAEPRATAEEFRANLEAMKAWADEHGVKVVLLRVNLEPVYADAVHRFAREAGVPLVNADELFETRGADVLASPL
ncbi:MAG: hypothetical protein K8I02_03660, partial [Candidatus Methylomirabilis sp.]|nr:hypothetical protein [Deltaproteobacteria bacterium]